MGPLPAGLTSLFSESSQITDLESWKNLKSLRIRQTVPQNARRLRREKEHGTHRDLQATAWGCPSQSMESRPCEGLALYLRQWGPLKTWGRGSDTTQGARSRGQILSSEWLTPEPMTFTQPHICGIPRICREKTQGKWIRENWERQVFIWLKENSSIRLLLRSGSQWNSKTAKIRFYFCLSSSAV